MGKDKFRLPQLRYRLTDFDEIWTLELPPQEHPTRKTSSRSHDVGGVGKYPVCHR